MKNALIFTILTWFSISAIAIEVTNIYQYKAVVDDKSQSEQRRANRVGFVGVLEKVSGQKVNRNHPVLKEAYRNLSSYVLKFEFEESLYQTYLTIRYQPQMIDNVLAQMEMPIWGNRRPLTLIWLAVEEGLQRSLVTKEDYPQIFHLLETNSDNAGLPIVLPLLDLEDRMSLSVTDVWGNFPQQIISASSRYEPEVIVSARLFRTENAWQLDWQFTNYSTFKLTSLQGDKLTIIGQLVGSIAEQIASQYAVVNSGHNEALIRFSGVHGLKGVESLKSRLRTLSQVDEIDVHYRRGENVELLLYLNASLENVKKSLKLDPQFEQVFDPFNYDADKPLEYRWLAN